MIVPSGSTIQTTSTVHPILNHLHSNFKEDHPGLSGFFIRDNMDNFSFGKTVSLAGSFFVCNSTVKMHIEESILLTGPKCGDQIVAGSSLIAGLTVDIKVPKMECLGTPEEPVLIVGIEGVSIEITEEAKLQNLVICLLNKARLSLSSASFAAFENVTVIRMELDGDKLLFGNEFKWAVHQDFIESASVQFSNALTQ